MSTATGYRIIPLELGPMENFVYLLVDNASARAAVVDPAWDIPTVVQHAEQLGVTISDILLTHSHHDHINGVEELLQRTDAQLHLLKPEAQFWGQHLDLPTLHHGGDVIDLGNTPIKILFTPGHTPGSACYHLGNDLITGDTMFVYGCGRCDLRGGDPEQMFDTLNKLRVEIPRNTVIRPGHNYSVTPTSTLDDEIAGNPFLHFEDRDKFVEYRMVIHDKTRHYPMAPMPPG
jgi:hydroxyacylglutathione hydrolase